MAEQPNTWAARPGRGRLAAWLRARRSATAPIWLLVVVAIAGVAGAVISSAHRADMVALENERSLLLRAFSDRRSEILREAEYFSEAQEAVQKSGVILERPWI